MPDLFFCGNVFFVFITVLFHVCDVIGWQAMIYGLFIHVKAGVFEKVLGTKC